MLFEEGKDEMVKKLRKKYSLFKLSSLSHLLGPNDSVPTFNAFTNSTGEETEIESRSQVLQLKV